MPPRVARPQTRPTDGGDQPKKIRVTYYDKSTGESKNKFAKMVPENSKISELPEIILKSYDEDKVYKISIDDEIITKENLDKPLKNYLKEGKVSIIKFYPEEAVICTFYSINNKGGKRMLINDFEDQDIYDIMEIDCVTDSCHIFNSKGELIDIEEDNKIKDESKFYLINYPKKFDELSQPKLYKYISNDLEIEHDDFQQLLDVFEKIKSDETLQTKLKNKKQTEPKYLLITSIFKSFLESLHEESQETKKQFLLFLYSLLFIKDEEENYFQLFEKIYDINDTPELKQLTAIFVDTSGSMLESFNHTKQKLYEAAIEIGNKIYDNIIEYNISDSIILSTSSKEKYETEEIPLKIDKNEVNGRTNIWDKLEFLLKEIKNKKGAKQIPSHIIIITDGEDTRSSKTREEILEEIHQENIIVDSIILSDNEYSQDPSVFSAYTNGVCHFARDIETAMNFVSKEPFFNLSIRKPIPDKDIPDYPFGNKNKKRKRTKRHEHFEQLEPNYNRPYSEFYIDYEYGLLKPSLEEFKEYDNILAKELLECLEEEEKNTKSASYYTFLIRNEKNKEEKVKKVEKPKKSDDDDYNEDEDKDEDDKKADFSKPIGIKTKNNDNKEGKKKMKIIKKDENTIKQLLKHWCIFANFCNHKRSIYWQMQIDFDSKYPTTLPSMRIISHPNLIKTNTGIISPYGAILLKKLLPDTKKHYSISKIMKVLISKLENNFDYDEIEHRYINSPVSKINMNLSKIIKVKFENDWTDDEDEAEIKEKSKIKTADNKSRIHTSDNKETDSKGKESSTMNPLEISFIDSLQRISQIGQGAQSRVYKVSQNKYFALKEIIFSSRTEDNEEKEEDLEKNKIDVFASVKKLLKEYEILMTLDHPNIIKTYGICFGDESHVPCILEEFCPYNLSIVVKKLTDINRVTIIYELSIAMREVHSIKVIHRDLKPENILIDEDYHVKLSDFGISCLPESTISEVSGVGTLKFMSPEVLNESEKITEKADVYSFGVVLFYILTNGTIPKISIGEISTGKKASIPVSINDFSRELINKCWSLNPEERPSFSEIVEMIEKNKFNLIDDIDKKIDKIKQFLSI